MSDLTPSIEESQDIVTPTQPTANDDDLLQPPAPLDPRPPVLITPQQVMFGTAAAVRPRSTPIGRRMINALRVVGAAPHRVVGAALRPPPPSPTDSRAWYFEDARMSREMDRL